MHVISLGMLCHLEYVAQLPEALRESFTEEGGGPKGALSGGLMVELLSHKHGGTGAQWRLLRRGSQQEDAGSAGWVNS